MDFGGREVGNGGGASAFVVALLRRYLEGVRFRSLDCSLSAGKGTGGGFGSEAALALTERYLENFGGAAGLDPSIFAWLLFSTAMFLRQQATKPSPCAHTKQAKRQRGRKRLKYYEAGCK